MVIVIGKGHSGTRAIAGSLANSGINMGHSVNESWDKQPFDNIFVAAWRAGALVTYRGDDQWNFRRLVHSPIPYEAQKQIMDYVSDVYTGNAGFKIPHANLIYPWLVRMFPTAHFVHWVRDPRDTALAEPKTPEGSPDELDHWGLRWDRPDDMHLRRIVCWHYYQEIVETTPRPDNFIRIKFEDYVNDPDNVGEQLTEFLGHPVTMLHPKSGVVDRWKGHAWATDLRGRGAKLSKRYNYAR